MTFDQKLLKQMILMITVEKTDSDGVAKILGGANMSAYSGQKVGIQNEHEGFDINLTPHFKL